MATRDGSSSVAPTERVSASCPPVAETMPITMASGSEKVLLVAGSAGSMHVTTTASATHDRAFRSKPPVTRPSSRPLGRTTLVGGRSAPTPRAPERGDEGWIEQRRAHRKGLGELPAVLETMPITVDSGSEKVLFVAASAASTNRGQVMLRRWMKEFVVGRRNTYRLIIT